MSNSNEVQIYSAPEKPRFNLVSWAGLSYTLLTGLIAVIAAYGTIKISQAEMQKDFDNLKAWTHEQKDERNEKIESLRKGIDDSRSEFSVKNEEIKTSLQQYVRKDEMQQQNEKLNMILDDTKYLRGRVDDLEIRKKNN